MPTTPRTSVPSLIRIFQFHFLGGRFSANFSLSYLPSFWLRLFISFCVKLLDIVFEFCLADNEWLVGLLSLSRWRPNRIQIFFYRSFALNGNDFASKWILHYGTSSQPVRHTNSTIWRKLNTPAHTHTDTCTHVKYTTIHKLQRGNKNIEVRRTRWKKRRRNFLFIE